MWCKSKDTCMWHKRTKARIILLCDAETRICDRNKKETVILKFYTWRSCVWRSVPTWLLDVTDCPAMCIRSRALDSGFLLHSDCSSFSTWLKCNELAVVFNFSCQIGKKHWSSLVMALSTNWCWFISWIKMTNSLKLLITHFIFMTFCHETFFFFKHLLCKLSL